MSWAEVEREQPGAVAGPDGYRGWHVVIWVRYAEGKPKRRERITWAPGIGKIKTKGEAIRVLQRIRAQMVDRHLREIVADYARGGAPENRVLYRWEHDFLTEWRRRHRAGEISQARLRELERMVPRGYLAHWEGESIFGVDQRSIWLWFAWLQKTFPHLAPVSVRHVLVNFRTFLGWEKRLGVMRGELPEFPSVRLPKRRRRVPKPESLARILAAIEEPRRGLWLARSQAGLRPSEARQLSVVHYRDGTIHIPAEIAKTREARSLHIRIVAPELDAWILKHRRGAAPGEPLFPNPRNAENRWRYESEWRVWARACRAAGVEHIRPNLGGRHAFATHEVHGGAPLDAVRQWLGHGDLNTTRRYIDEYDPVELARTLRPRTAQSLPSTPRRVREVPDESGS